VEAIGTSGHGVRQRFQGPFFSCETASKDQADTGECRSSDGKSEGPGPAST